MISAVQDRLLHYAKTVAFEGGSAAGFALYYVNTRMPLECAGFVVSYPQLTLRQLNLTE